MDRCFRTQANELIMVSGIFKLGVMNYVTDNFYQKIQIC
jgi:hypothetical protein